MDTNSALPNQSSNIIGASFGALVGLSTLAWIPAQTPRADLFANLITRYLQKEPAVEAIVAAVLILFLGQFKPQGAKAMALCGALGLACARLTISLIQ